MKKFVYYVLLSTIILFNINILYASDFPAYQGIFQRDNEFISVTIYTSFNSENKIGVCYSVTRPSLDEYNYVVYDIIDELGEVYEQSDNIYFIIGSDKKYEITYYENSIQLTAVDNMDSKYSGLYNQVSNAGADMNPNDIWLNINENPNISVLLNGNKLSFDENPYINNSTTMVPMRKIFESLGANVYYDTETKLITAQKDNITIELYAGLAIAKINGKPYNLPIAIENKNGHTMVPLRFISESLGANVEWNAEKRDVIIVSQ